jgi:hypothetical protein
MIRTPPRRRRSFRAEVLFLTVAHRGLDDPSVRKELRHHGGMRVGTNLRHRRIRPWLMIRISSASSRRNAGNRLPRRLARSRNSNGYGSPRNGSSSRKLLSGEQEGEPRFGLSRWSGRAQDYRCSASVGRKISWRAIVTACRGTLPVKTDRGGGLSGIIADNGSPSSIRAIAL